MYKQNWARELEKLKLLYRLVVNIKSKNPNDLFPTAILKIKHICVSIRTATLADIEPPKAYTLISYKNRNLFSKFLPVIVMSFMGRD